MAFADDLQKTVEAIDRISKDGVPIVVKHEFETSSMTYLLIGAFVVGLLLVALCGVKDVAVNRLSKT